MLVAEKSHATQDLASEVKQLREEVARLKKEPPKPRLDLQLIQIANEQDQEIRKLREDLGALHEKVWRLESARLSAQAASSIHQKPGESAKLDELRDRLIRAFDFIQEDRQRLDAAIETINAITKTNWRLWNENEELRICVIELMHAKYPGYWKTLAKIEDIIGIPDMSTRDSFAPPPTPPQQKN